VKDGLRATISAGLVPTFTTGLAGMPGVDLDHLDTACLCFVLDKGVQLGKTPTMQASFILAFLTVLFAPAQIGVVPDVLEILQDESTARGGMLNNLFGENVIVVSASPKLFTRELLEVSLGASGAFGLQFAFQTKDASFLFLPLLLTQELTSRGHSRAIQSQVYAYYGRGWGDGRLRNGYNDMQRVASLAIAQISATGLVPNILLKVSRHCEGQFNPPVYGGKATGERVPLDPVRTLVIADTGHLTVRATNRLESRNGLAQFLGFLNLFWICLFLLDLPGKRALDGFCRLDACRTYQLSRQIRVLRSQRIVCALVQLHAIATCCHKPFTGYNIKASGMLLKGCLEASRLLWCGLQLDSNRSIHTECISYIATFGQWHGMPLCPSPKKGAALTSPGIHAGVSRADFDDGAVSVASFLNYLSSRQHPSK